MSSVGVTNGVFRMCNGLLAVVSFAMLVREGIHTPWTELPAIEMTLTFLLGSVCAHHYFTGKWLPWGAA